VITRSGSRLARELEQSAVRVRPVGWEAGLSPTAVRAIWAEARRQPAALLHAHDGHSLTLVGAVATVQRRPFVVTRRLSRPLRRPGFWRRAARIVAVSEAVRRSLLAARIDPGRIVVIHSGIEIERGDERGAGAVRSELGIPADAPLVVSIGALVPEKAHHLLVEAAALLRPSHPAIHWALVGAGPERSRLASLRTERGLEGCFHLVGHHPDPARFLPAATVFVSSSVEEALGTSILDAMAAGIPVVATAVGGVPELLGEGGGILVAPNRADLLAAAVARVASDQTTAQRVTREAAERLTGFTARGMADQVLEMYRSVVLDL
jgi:glycosyltransferase involved in cell wall biosynthesis